MRVASLHCLTLDSDTLSYEDQLRAFLAGGSKCVQLRAKRLDAKEILPLAQRLQKLCQSQGADLIINDHVAVAKAVGAGVHLGSGDGDPLQARRLLGDHALLGQTVNNVQTAKRVRDLNVASYVGVGPWRFTSTKAGLSPVLRREEIVEIIQVLDPLPVILIGGVRLNDLQTIFGTRAHGLAVSSALVLAENPESATSDFLRSIKEIKT
jgi:thiamine-phosphate pyrophosphorylase